MKQASFQTYLWLTTVIRELPKTPAKKEQLAEKVKELIQDEGLDLKDVMNWYNDSMSYKTLISTGTSVKLARIYREMDETSFVHFFPEFEGMFLPIQIG